MDAVESPDRMLPLKLFQMFGQNVSVMDQITRSNVWRAASQRYPVSLNSLQVGALTLRKHEEWRPEVPTQADALDQSPIAALKVARMLCSVAKQRWPSNLKGTPYIIGWCR